MKEHLYYSPSAVGGPILRKSGTPQMTHWAVALTPDGQCVFGERRNLKPSDLPKGYMVYDDEVERQRRLVCDSALGQLVLDNPGVAYRAVKMVNDSIRRFVADFHRKEVMAATRVYEDRVSKTTKEMPLGQFAVAQDGKYVTGETSFGKHEEFTWGSESGPLRRADEWVLYRATMNRWLAAFNEPDLPRQVGLHDVFLKVYCSGITATSGAKNHTPQQLANSYGLREDWYDKDPRGRSEKKKGTYGQSDEIGLLGPNVTIPWKGAMTRCGIAEATRRKESRERGIDKYQMDVEKILPAYHKELQKYNLGFSAAVSGTTSTLLTSAYTFAPQIRSDSELKKQYLLACVGYLVGSGMHTCHEVFYTGNRAGLPYKTGKYLDMLPQSFLKSEVGQKWQDEFWEFVRPDRRTPR